MATHADHHTPPDKKAAGGSSRGSFIEESVLSLNRWRVFRGTKTYLPEEVIVLCPHCLQNSACACKILVDAKNCRRCGKCSIKDLVEVAARYQAPIHFVAGGREAVRLVKQPAVKAIVAVACGKELFAGLLKAFGKRIVTVHNEWPHGPCKDTFVDYRKVEEALRLLRGSP
jgi:hypothetical protein